MNLQDLMLLEVEDEMAATRRMLERVPDASFSWKPHEKSMTLGRLASHVADLPNRCLTILTTEELVRPPDFKPYLAESSRELLERFDTAAASARTALNKLDPDRLDATWSIRVGDRTLASLPRGLALRRVFMNHLVHHRGQLSVYLRLLEIPVPGMYGASADEGGLPRK